MSLWDFAKMKDSILMNGCSIPHCKEDGLRAVLQQEPPVRNVILGYIKHNEACYRYITTCQEKSCHLEMHTSKDYPASWNFLHCSQGKERGDHRLCQRSTPSSLQRRSGNGVRLGRKADGSWAATLCSSGDLMDACKALIQQLPRTSLIPQQQALMWTFLPTAPLWSKLKLSPKKGSRWLNLVLKLPCSFGSQPLFNTPNKGRQGFSKYHLPNIE